MAKLIGTKTTGEVAAELKVSECWLQNLFRLGKMKKPPKAHGKLRWSMAHVQRARLILKNSRAWGVQAPAGDSVVSGS